VQRPNASCANLHSSLGR